MRQLTLIVLLVACQTALAGATERFTALYEKEWQFRLQEFPTLATSVGDHSQNHRLARVAESDQLRRHQFWTSVLTELAAIERSALDRNDRANYDIFKRQLDNFVSEYQSGAYLIPMNSDYGFHVDLARLPDTVPLNNQADYENYLSRLGELPAVMDEYIELMRTGIIRGMTLPRVVLTGRDEAIRAQLLDDPAKSGFYQPFSSFPESISSEQQRPLIEQALKLIEAGVIPAYARFLEFFTQEYTPAARVTLAAGDLPGGEAYYAGRVRYYTTLDLTPRQIHEMGIKEVARIREQMLAIIVETHFEGDFAEFLSFLRNDPRFYASTPRQLLMEASYIAKRMDGKLPSLFKTLPRQPYGVEAVPADLAPFFTGGRYSGAPIHSTRAGAYWVNTWKLDSRPLYTLPALTLHEAVPGHHLQGALAQELDQQPPFRRNSYISAYGEGWGLYAEWLGVEAGIYQTPYEHFGRLTYEMWRACRLVIDTGVHAFGWTREQAIDYLSSHTALSMHEINTEIDRYISWPAQALSYKLGEMKIKALRQQAQQRLGEQFDLRAFHDTVLAQGSVPLSLLEESVQEWIKTTLEES